MERAEAEMRNASEEEGKPNKFLFGQKGEILFSDDEDEKISK